MNLDSTDEGEVAVREGNKGGKRGNVLHMRKGGKVAEAKGEDSPVVEDSGSSESLDSDQLNQANQDSDDEPSSSDNGAGLVLVSESASEETAPSPRKPSKRALEMALNEVSQVLRAPAG